MQNPIEPTPDQDQSEGPQPVGFWVDLYNPFPKALDPEETFQTVGVYCDGTAVDFWAEFQDAIDDGCFQFRPCLIIGARRMTPTEQAEHFK